MVGSSHSVKGGITTVINQLLGFELNSEFEYKFLPTYFDKNKLTMLCSFIVALCKEIVYILLWKPTMLHVHMSYKGSFTRKKIVCRIAWFFGLPTILHLHGSEFEAWYKNCSDNKQKKIRTFLLKQKCVIVLGTEWENILKKIDKDINIKVIHNSVEIPYERANWNTEQINVLFLAVLLERKGIYDLINTVNLMLEKYPELINKFRFTIAGTGPEEAKAKKIVTEKGLSKYIKFYGWVDKINKKNLILEHQLGWLPSYNEGLPMTILECMSYGVPMLTTPVGSIPSVIKNGKNGLLAKSGDCVGMLEQLVRINDIETWSKLSDNARLTIKENFNQEVVLRQLTKIYRGES